MASFGRNGVVHIRRLVSEWRKKLSSIGLARLQQKDDIYALAYQRLYRSTWSANIVSKVSEAIAIE